MKYRRLLSVVIACCVPALMQGCASSLDARHPMDQGWRAGEVDHDVALDESTPLVRFSEDCRAMMSPVNQTAPVRWTLLHFRRPPEEVFRVVPNWADHPLAPGQPVYLNVEDCTKPVEPR